MLTQPDILPVDDGLYELAAGWEYRWLIGGVENRIVIPAGFRFDGASVPRLAWSLTGILPDGLHRAAAMLHDWLYQHGGLLPAGSQWSRNAGDEQWRPVFGRWSRQAADRMFGRLMREAGVGVIRRRLAWRAVRLFGASAWKH